MARTGCGSGKGVGGERLLTILSVGYPFAPVSLDAAGGSEQILALLDRELVKAGHRSIVVAPEGSSVRGELIEVPAAPPCSDDTEIAATRGRWKNAIMRAMSRRRVDLVHFHSLDFHQYLPPAGPPVLVTLHLPRSFYPEEIFNLNRPQTWFNCVSSSQLRTFPRSPLFAGKIENGIPLDLLQAPPVPRGEHVLALGRICPEKGLHLAVDAAERAGVALYLAGKVFPYPEHVQYWREVLKPRLRPPHRFLGSLNFRDKVRAMSAARCLLVPSLVAETSSLVTMEAMACGTPVVAFRSGALAELIDDGRTGYVVENTGEMAEGITNVGYLDRKACRTAARTRFSGTRMVQQYQQLYEQLRVSDPVLQS